MDEFFDHMGNTLTAWISDRKMDDAPGIIVPHFLAKSLRMPGPRSLATVVSRWTKKMNMSFIPEQVRVSW